METIVLDPSEVATGRVEFDITDWIDAEGVDWGDAEITTYMAEQARGSSPVDFRVPNRTVTAPLIAKTRGTVTFDQFRQSIQAKVARIQQEGGWLKRVTSSGGTVYADIVNATLKLGGGWLQAHRDADPDAVLTLEAIPDWYGDEVTLGDHVETTQTTLLFTDTGIDGDYPGRVRIVVDEDQGQNQRGLIWGIRSKHYSADPTARLKFSASNFTQLDTTTGTNWTSLYSTDLTSGPGSPGALTHSGTYRVWAKLTVTNSAPLQLRWVWDVGDLVLPVENAPTSTPGAAGTWMINLGEVRLDPIPTVGGGAHNWKGILQGKGSVGGETLTLHEVYFVPVDDGYGVLRAPVEVSQGLSQVSARDEFNQSAGNLGGKTLPVGGTWSTSGAPTDFAVEATSHTARRTTLSDLSSRYAVASTPSLASVAVQASMVSTVAMTSPDVAPALGLVARWVDSQNFVEVILEPGLSGGTSVQVYKWIANSQLFLGGETIAGALTSSTTVHLQIDATGQWFVFTGPSSSSLTLAANGRDIQLATGGTLATGKVGIRDRNRAATAMTRTLDDFVAYVPTADAVMFASQSTELRTDGMVREDPARATYGPVSRVVGALPRYPPSGTEGRTVEVFLRASRGDLDRLEDTGQDDISARVHYRPSWLIVPGS